MPSVYPGRRRREIDWPPASCPSCRCRTEGSPARYKYARYFDGLSVASEEGEFYDLEADPTEMANKSVWAENQRNPLQKLASQADKDARASMETLLNTAVATRLQPLSAPPVTAPQNLAIEAVSWLDENSATQQALEITFYSRSGTSYQLQQSSDLLSWTNIGPPVPGNNGPVLFSEPMASGKNFLSHLLQRRVARSNHLVLKELAPACGGAP